MYTCSSSHLWCNVMILWVQLKCQEKIISEKFLSTLKGCFFLMSLCYLASCFLKSNSSVIPKDWKRKQKFTSIAHINVKIIALYKHMYLWLAVLYFLQYCSRCQNLMLFCYESNMCHMYQYFKIQFYKVYHTKSTKIYSEII
jgi:hypothetical protein